MNELVNVFCKTCKKGMVYASGGGSSINKIQKTIYVCPKCHTEVMVTYDSN